MPTQRRFFIVQIVLYILFLLCVQELALRFFFPLPELKNFNRVNYMQLGFSQDNVTGIANINLEIQSAPDDARFIHTLNRYGFRDVEWKIDKPEGKRRVIFIGDSFVEGEMAADDEILSDGFKQSLGEKSGDFEVLNMGIMAGNRSEYLKLIYDAVPVFKPDYLFLVFYANDFALPAEFPQGSFSPQRYDPYLPRLIELVDMIKNGEALPFRWNYRKVRFFKAVPDPNNPWTTNEEELQRYVTPKMAEAMKNGLFNPFAINDLYAKSLYLKRPLNIRAELQRLQNFLKKHQSRLVISYIPSRHQVTNYYQQYEREYCLQCPPSDLTQNMYQLHAWQLAAEARQLQIPFFDLTKDIKRLEKEGVHLFWKYDEHMKGEGYLKSGELMAEWWLKKP